MASRVRTKKLHSKAQLPAQPPKAQRPKAQPPKAQPPKAKATQQPQRLFRYVTWCAKRKVWQARRFGRPCAGRHADQHEAAKLAAKAYGFSLEELQLKPAEPAASSSTCSHGPTLRLYKYLTWHKLAGEWQVQRKGYPSPGRHFNQHEAAKLASQAFKIPLHKLQLYPKAGVMPKERLFKHVYWHTRDQLWYVIAPGGQTCPGSFATQHGAAQLAAKVWKQPVGKLRLRGHCQPGQQKRQYKFVSYHKRSKTWIAKSNKSWLGSSTSQKKAVACAAKALKCSPAELQLSNSGVARQQSLDEHIVRFQQMWPLFRGTCPHRPKVPGDLADLMSRGGGQSLALLEQCAGLIVPFLLAKYGPHRDSMEAAWIEQTSKQPKADAVQLVYDVLVATLQKIDGTKLRPCWVESVGRNCAHHSGLIPFANTSLGILQPSPKATKGTLRLGQEGRHFLVEELTPTVRSRLSTLVSFGQALLTAKVPKTVQSWASTTKTLQQAVMRKPGTCGLSGPKAYRTLWVIRSWLIWRMRRAGVMQLQVPKACMASEFAKLFPDQKAWLLKLAGKGKASSTPAINVFAKIGYTGPPELFSMFTCLWGGSNLRKQLQALPPNWLEVNRPTLLRARFLVRTPAPVAKLGTVSLSCRLLAAKVCQEYEEKEGQVPHPSVLVDTAQRTLLQAEPLRAQNLRARGLRARGLRA